MSHVQVFWKLEAIDLGKSTGSFRSKAHSRCHILAADQSLVRPKKLWGRQCQRPVQLPMFRLLSRASKGYNSWLICAGEGLWHPLDSKVSISLSNSKGWGREMKQANIGNFFGSKSAKKDDKVSNLLLNLVALSDAIVFSKGGSTAG